MFQRAQEIRSQKSKPFQKTGRVFQSVAWPSVQASLKKAFIMI